MSILERIAGLKAQRALVSDRAETVVEGMKELAAELAEVPGYQNVGVVIDHGRATVDGRVAGTMVVPRIDHPVRGMAFYEFEIRQSAPAAGTISVRELDRDEGRTFVYGAEPTKGRERFAAVVAVETMRPPSRSFR